MLIDREMKNTMFGLISFCLMEISIRIGMLLSQNVNLRLIAATLKQTCTRNLAVFSAFTLLEVVA